MYGTEHDPPLSTVKTSFEIVEKILELDRDQEGVGVTELSEEMGVPISTVHDHLKTLHQVGYLTKSGSKYRIGSRFLAIGEQFRYRNELFRITKPELRKLADRTGEHAWLMIEERGRGVMTYLTGLGNDISISPRVGKPTHLHTTGAGKAILAHLPDERVDRIVAEGGLPAKTEKTITDRDDLLDELEWIREQGYAVEREERLDGLISIATPIFGDEDEIHGSISLSGPVSRMDGDPVNEDVLSAFMNTANVIRLNYRYP